MAAHLTDIGNAVVTGLNAGTFTQSFTASRVVDPDRKLSDLGSLSVKVFARKERSELQSRSGVLLCQYDVDVVIEKRLTATTANTYHDQLVWLTQEIADHFYRNALPGRSERLMAAGTDATDPFSWDIERTDEAMLYRAIVTLTFQGTR